MYRRNIVVNEEVRDRQRAKQKQFSKEKCTTMDKKGRVRM